MPAGGTKSAMNERGTSIWLSSDKGALLTLRETRVHLKLMTLLTGNPGVAYRGRIGAGEISGDVSLGKTRGWTVQCRGVRLEDIPYFATVAQAVTSGSIVRVRSTLCIRVSQRRAARGAAR